MVWLVQPLAQILQHGVANAASESRMMPAAPQPPDPATILVVEDDDDTREFVVMLVGSAGYHALAAASGGAALALLATEAVDGVVLDFRLPDMDGLAVCRYLRAHGHRHLPIILVTADQTPELARQATDAGVSSFLAKPFAPEAFLARLTQFLPA